jgi:STE24 endopeptidase
VLTAVFVFAVVLHLIVQLGLARRQIAHVSALSDRVPERFATVISAEEHAQAAKYTAAKQRLGMFEAVFEAAVLLLLTLGGGISALAAWVSGWSNSGILTGTALVLAVFVVLSVAALPFNVYRTFVLEERFGFNRSTPAVFVTDLLKSALVGGLLGGALVAAILFIMSAAGQAWWIVAWAVWLAFSLLITLAWPRFIAPLFNRFWPLDNAELRSRIDALLARCDFRTKSVYIMDGSRRSAHGNAYFTGLGREKRIVFFDTLLATLTPAQIESVLAHELAHFKLRHIPQRLVLSAVLSFAGFALLGWLSRQPWFYASLGVSEASNATALLLFILVVPVFSWIVSPALSAWSRRHEFEADAFAAQHSNASELADALVALYKDNANTLTPDPLYSAFYDSHPPPAIRIERLLAR